jgi:2-oxoglutarate ferredoxin oxidoreductase subunit gamma
VNRTGIEDESVKVYSMPILETAHEKLHNELCANVVALGVIVGLTEIVGDEAVQRALANNFNAKVLPINMEAYSLGVEIAKSNK